MFGSPFRIGSTTVHVNSAQGALAAAALIVVMGMAGMGASRDGEQPAPAKNVAPAVQR